MFEDVLLSSPRSRAPALVISYALQLVLLGLLVLVPLLHVEALPKWLVTPPIVRPPSGGPSAHSVAIRRAPPRHITLEKLLMAPVSIPPGAKRIQEEPLLPEESAAVGPFIPGAIPGGGTQGVPFSLGQNANWLAPAPPQPQAKPTNTRQIRLGGVVAEAKLIYHPNPEYPTLARMARVQGTVILEAIIARDGTIQELKVLSGPALLVQAARDAVERWRYQPTLLNNEPVEVLTEISVRFTLAE